jgi:hypothetical protein
VLTSAGILTSCPGKICSPNSAPASLAPNPILRRQQRSERHEGTTHISFVFVVQSPWSQHWRQ